MKIIIYTASVLHFSWEETNHYPITSTSFVHSNIDSFCNVCIGYAKNNPSYIKSDYTTLNIAALRLYENGHTEFVDDRQINL